MASVDVRDILGDQMTFTDGSCKPNPGQGTWAWVEILSNGNEVALTGSDEYTTNQRMELKAVIEALKAGATEIVTDSKYVEGWVKKLLKQQGAGGPLRDVPNKDLLEALRASLSDGVTVTRVRGHAGHEGNERAHALAEKHWRRVFGESNDVAARVILGGLGLEEDLGS